VRVEDTPIFSVLTLLPLVLSLQHGLCYVCPSWSICSLFIGAFALGIRPVSTTVLQSSSSITLPTLYCSIFRAFCFFSFLPIHYHSFPPSLVVSNSPTFESSVYVYIMLTFVSGSVFYIWENRWPLGFLNLACFTLHGFSSFPHYLWMTKFHFLWMSRLKEWDDKEIGLNAELLSGHWITFWARLLRDSLETLLQGSPGHCADPASIPAFAQRAYIIKIQRIGKIFIKWVFQILTS
jgi:hypothetical protein